jgi:hypothetical protein
MKGSLEACPARSLLRQERHLRPGRRVILHYMENYLDTGALQRPPSENPRRVSNKLEKCSHPTLGTEVPPPTHPERSGVGLGSQLR